MFVCLVLLGCNIPFELFQSISSRSSYEEGVTTFVVNNLGLLISAPKGINSVVKNGIQLPATTTNDEAVRNVAVNFKLDGTSIISIRTNVFLFPVISMKYVSSVNTDIKLPPWLVVSSVKYSTLLSNLDSTNRSTFWLLFLEFTVISTITG